MKTYTASIMHPSSLPASERKYAKEFMGQGCFALVERENGSIAGVALSKGGGSCRILKRMKKEWLANNG